jgi:hypothetical protein
MMRRLALVSLSLLFALGGLGVPVGAAIVAGSGSGTSVETLHPDFDSELDGLGGWIVDDAGAPLPVSADPSAGPWIKMFSGFGSATFGTTFVIHEKLVVAPGSPAWTDWHEDIMTPGWVWSTAMLKIDGGTPIPGPTGGPMTGWLFPPEDPGTPIEVWKEISCDLPGGCGGSITIHEFPTVPVPGAWLLFATAIAGLPLLRRRSG